MVIGIFGTDLYVNGLFMRRNSVVVSLMPHAPDNLFIGRGLAALPPLLCPWGWLLHEHHSGCPAAAVRANGSTFGDVKDNEHSRVQDTLRVFPVRHLARAGITTIQWRDSYGRQTEPVHAVPVVDGVTEVRLKAGEGIIYSDLHVPIPVVRRLLAEGLVLLDVELG